MKKVATTVDKIIEKISTIFLWISAVCVFMMAFVSFIDVILRYFFNSPISGGQEMVKCFMALFVFCGMGMATRRYKLTRVPLFLDKFGEALRNFVKAFGSIICCATSALFCSQLMKSAIQYFSKPSSVVQTLNIPMWILYGIASIGCGLMSLEMLIRGIKEIISGIRAVNKRHNKSKGVA